MKTKLRTFARKQIILRKPKKKHIIIYYYYVFIQILWYIFLFTMFFKLVASSF